MKKLSFDSENDSIATILRRKKLRDNLYQFTFDNVLIGHYDAFKDVFISSYGKEYPSIRSTEFLNSKDNQGFYLCLNRDDLSAVFSIDNDLHSKFLINKYIEYVKNFMYFVKVKKKNNGKYTIHIRNIDLNKIEDSFVNTNKEEDDLFIEEFLSSNKHNENFLDSYYSENTNIPDDLDSLIANIYNCEYNSSQLFTIAENVLFLKDYLEKTLESIELQLHAYYDCDKQPLHPDESDFEFINTNYDPYSDFIRERSQVNDDFSISENESKSIKRKLDIIKLRDQIKKYLINQDEALRRVLAEIARMYVKGDENNKGILLMGDTGTGKTYLMELLSKYLDVPFIRIDTTQLTIPGYIGKNIEEYLWELYVSCDKNLEKAENAIVYFDEIDKKGSKRKSDASGQGVLNVLLKFLDGTTYDACSDVRNSNEKVKINTSKMKIIAGGAFKDVFTDDYGKKKENFGFALNNKNEESNSDINDIPDVDVFVQKAFMTPEFIGRFPIKIRLKPHTVDSFSEVLLNAEDSTLKEEIRTFGKFGVKLSTTPGFIKLASTEALKLKTGVRGLMGTIEDSTWVAFEDVYNNPDKYAEIILTEETLKDPNNYQKVLKRKYDEKKLLN